MMEKKKGVVEKNVRRKSMTEKNVREQHYAKVRRQKEKAGEAKAEERNLK